MDFQAGFLPCARHRSKAIENSVAVRKASACQRAAAAAPVVEALRGAGASLRDVAAELTRLGVPTPLGGGVWRATKVARVMSQL